MDKVLPPDIHTRITLKADAEWPDDGEMRQAVFERQVAAWQELQALRSEFGADEFVRPILQLAAEDWPDDFEMELHTFKQQAAAGMAFQRFTAPDVPARVLEQFKLDALLAWPQDCEMRLLVLERRVEVWRGMPGGEA